MTMSLSNLPSDLLTIIQSYEKTFYTKLFTLDSNCNELMKSHIYNNFDTLIIRDFVTQPPSFINPNNISKLIISSKGYENLNTKIKYLNILDKRFSFIELSANENYYILVLLLTNSFKTCNTINFKSACLCDSVIINTIYSDFENLKNVHISISNDCEYNCKNIIFGDFEKKELDKISINKVDFGKCSKEYGHIIKSFIPTMSVIEYEIINNGKSNRDVEKVIIFFEKISSGQIDAFGKFQQCYIDRKFVGFVGKVTFGSVLCYEKYSLNERFDYDMLSIDVDKYGNVVINKQNTKMSVVVLDKYGNVVRNKQNTKSVDLEY